MEVVHRTDGAVMRGMSFGEEIFENLFPKGHPYHHSTIGSMDDLNSASLDDVKKWFTDNYGPNHSPTLALAVATSMSPASTSTALFGP